MKIVSYFYHALFFVILLKFGSKLRRDIVTLPSFRLYFIKNSDLYNYADDNALSYSDHDINKVISTLEDDSVTLINWFSGGFFTNIWHMFIEI
jgi:hypothetical protein